MCKHNCSSHNGSRAHAANKRANKRAWRWSRERFAKETFFLAKMAFSRNRNIDQLPHLPSCRSVSLRFVSLPFPLHSFSFLSLSCPFQFPFVSLSFPVAFLTCGLPISSPHFLALPGISPLLPSISRKKTLFFPAFSQRGRPTTQSFSRLFLALPCISPWLPSISHKNTVFPAFSQRGPPKENLHKQAGNPNQQKAGRGNRAWDPCFSTPAPRRLRLVERHQITARYGGNPPPPLPPPVPHVSDVGRAGGV